MCQSAQSSAALPDAPSALVSAQCLFCERVAGGWRSSAIVSTDGVPDGRLDRRDSANVFAVAPGRKESGDFFDRHVYPQLVERNSRYRPSDNAGWMGRATEAASSVVFVRDDSGQRKLNTSYLLRVATLVAAHSARRPYWRRTGSAPFSDFGSTVGNDAGMNLLHEFGPAMQHVVSGHIPEFVTRIEQGFLRQQERR